MNDFVLKNTETLPDGIKRIIGSQVDLSLFNIGQNIDKDFDESVHEARKCSKRIRAVLRLVRDETGNGLFKRENYLFRDINRYLSETRNIAVIIETLNKVAKDNAGHDHSRLINDTIRLKYKLIDVLFVGENRLETVIGLLDTGKERSMALPLKINNINVLLGSLLRVYKLCVKCMNNARKDPSDENLHEWRKQVKYLYYQFQVLTPYLTDDLVSHKPNLDKIAELLGEDHDLAELISYLDNISGLYKADQEIKALKAGAGNDRSGLQSLIFSLAGESFDKNTEKQISNLITN